MFRRFLDGFHNMLDAVASSEIKGLIAIDLQEAAIRATRVRIEAISSLPQVELLVADHSQALKSLCSK